MSQTRLLLDNNNLNNRSFSSECSMSPQRTLQSSCLFDSNKINENNGRISSHLHGPKLCSWNSPSMTCKFYMHIWIYKFVSSPFQHIRQTRIQLLTKSSCSGGITLISSHFYIKKKNSHMDNKNILITKIFKWIDFFLITKNVSSIF